jgi:hypothetical protein
LKIALVVVDSLRKDGDVVVDRCSHLERRLQTEVFGGEEVVKRDESD